MPPDILKEVVFQVLQKITIEDGDILILRCDISAIEKISDAMREINLDKRILLVHEDFVEFLGEVDEEMMNSIGWYRKEKDADTSR